MDRVIVWNIDAQNSRKALFFYWNKRNKSREYSKKLNLQFLEALKLVSKIPETGIQTELINIRLKLVSHFEIIYSITETEIVVLDIWDFRQNPDDFPIK